MIISASYKTDIPTFYGAWFINRLRAGYCKMVNPYNFKVYHVDLSPEAVDGYVFWTKNIWPFMQHLEEVHRRGFPFIVQYSINGYPRALEYSVVDAMRAVEHIKRLSAEYSPKVAVWRYDTIVFTSLTELDFHRRNFAKLAKALEGATDEVVISFANIYRKTRRNMDIAAKEFGFTWDDPPDEIKYKLAIELAEVAKFHNMQLTMCGQRQFLAPGIGDARCVDAGRLAAVAGKPVDALAKPHRKECGCFQSKDIGEYHTCPHGCVYCYAVQNHEKAQQRYKAHDPHGEFLFAPKR
ncbi:MAG: DUF1848 domain-containing protein [bacterium]